MKIKIDTYYDITCEECGRSWSTDFNMNEKSMNSGGMGMWQDKALLSKAAYKSGWKCRHNKTLCPECAAKKPSETDEERREREWEEAVEAELDAHINGKTQWEE